jgi:hypothetical protein
MKKKNGKKGDSAASTISHKLPSFFFFFFSLLLRVRSKNHHVQTRTVLSCETNKRLLTVLLKHLQQKKANGS